MYDQEYKTCFNKNISGVAAEDIHDFLKKLKSGIRNQNQPPDMFCKRRWFFRKFHRTTYVLECLFDKAPGLKVLFWVMNRWWIIFADWLTSKSFEGFSSTRTPVGGFLNCKCATHREQDSNLYHLILGIVGWSCKVEVTTLVN